MAQRRRWEDLATTASKRLLGSGGQGGDNDGDVDPRGDDYNDTTISLAMAMATRVAGDKECNGGKSDGDDKRVAGKQRQRRRRASEARILLVEAIVAT